jgi:hypothetical protein
VVEGRAGSTGTTFETETSSDCYTKQHCHLCKNFVVSEQARILNGDAGYQGIPPTGMHHLEGGGARHDSRLVNGNMDMDSFIRVFCSPRESSR